MTDVVKIDNLESNLETVDQEKPKGGSAKLHDQTPLIGFMGVIILGLLISTIGLAVANNNQEEGMVHHMEMLNALATAKPPAGVNPCDGMKPAAGAGFDNWACAVEGVTQALAQAGANVTAGYQGDLVVAEQPITEAYVTAGLCAVNVHWHLGAEHLSEGEFDDHGSGPTDIHHRRKLAGIVRKGAQCHHYDSHEAKFTTEYDWQHCKDMEVGQTYEVHWPHSKAGACGTPNQYQTPFYDGVFCNVPASSYSALTPAFTAAAIGVQAQVFTIVNDEDYYYPDLMRGAIVDGDKFAVFAKYTGSTTGTSRDNVVCSKYTPITWQVDRKFHMISASSFDKMCGDMKAQRDDMSDDLHAHGARELVADQFSSNNQQL